MSIRRCALAVAAAIGVGLLVVPIPSASAATVDASGWWFRGSTATPTQEVPQPIPGGPPTVPATAPGPPTVPAGMLHVEGIPAGATAIAAVTFRLAAGETNPILTIRPDATSAVPPGALIIACRASIEWVPPATPPGAWETKPLVDCSRSVQAQPGDAGALVFPLQPLLDGRLLDVVIVPGADPATAAVAPEAAGSVLSMTFPVPDAASLATTLGGPTDGDEEFEALPDYTPAPGFGGSDSGFGSFDSGTGGLTLPPLDAPVQPALEPQDQAPAVPRVTAPLAAATDVVDADDVRLLGMLVIAGCALTAYLSANQPGPAAVGLGRFARPVAGGAAMGLELEERGLGRLRKARTGPPPSL